MPKLNAHLGYQFTEFDPLERFAQAACTLVFFERKDRLADSLALALEAAADIAEE